jgi:large subunit ribosomal protein L25
MEKFKLALATRDIKEKPNKLRREGKIPATIYGPGEPSTSVQIDAREFSRLPAAAFSHIIELDGGPSNNVNAIVRHVQRKAVSQQVLNIEFYRVAADRKLTVEVPLRFVGESPAVKGGGQLIELFQAAEIECLPADIPDFIEVDISQIVELEQGIHFSELKISDKIEILNPPDEMVARVVVPREIKVEEEAPAAAAAAATPDAAAAAAPAGDKAAAPAAEKAAAPAAKK